MKSECGGMGTLNNFSNTKPNCGAVRRESKVRHHMGYPQQTNGSARIVINCHSKQKA